MRRQPNRFDSEQKQPVTKKGTMTATKTTHTPGPLGSPTWKVIGHPLLKDRHPFHQNRYVVSSDVVVEIYDHNPDVRQIEDWDSAWGLRNGVIICELRDSTYQKRYADLIAAAPELLEALQDLVRYGRDFTWAKARAAIAKAEGRA